MSTFAPTNVEIAEALEQMADLLLRQGEPNPYRIQAYLVAAAMIRDEHEPVAIRYGDGGREALAELPGIGVALASHIGQLIDSGRIGLRDRLLQAEDPIALLQTLPGISARLATILVGDLGIRSLAELERAALDGRLAAVPGVGPRTVEAVRLQLNSILDRAARRRARRLRRQAVQLVARSRAAADAAEREADADAERLDASPQGHATIYELFPAAVA